MFDFTQKPKNKKNKSFSDKKSKKYAEQRKKTLFNLLLIHFDIVMIVKCINIEIFFRISIKTIGFYDIWIVYVTITLVNILR